MITRTCLFIDDERQDAIFPKIEKQGRQNGLDIKCYQFNVGNQERQDLLENGEISLPKVVEVFRTEFREIRFDLIAFDWNIGSGITGPTLIKAFNDERIRIRVPKILYSGVLKEEIQKICDEYRDNHSIPFKKVWDEINTLISTNALAFVGRENYDLFVVRELGKVEDTFEASIEEELRRFPDFIFNYQFPNRNFQGKTFAEISQIIEGNNHLRNEFIKEFTQQVIAYLTEKI